MCEVMVFHSMGDSIDIEKAVKEGRVQEGLVSVVTVVLKRIHGQMDRREVNGVV